MLVFFVIVFIASLIGKAVVYTDQEKARKLEYCISQNQSFQDCFIMIHRGYDFDKISK